MANKDNEITRDDILALVDVKTKVSDITYSDIFKTIDNIRPNNTREFWKYFWIPLVVSSISIVGMLFLTPDTAWHRLSIIIYAICCVGGIIVFRRFDKNIWWLLLVEILILYLIFAETLTMDGLIKLIEKVI